MANAFPSHFPYEEMIFSSAAVRHHLPNDPPAELLPNLVNTANNLQRVREALSAYRGVDTPIQIISGYRSPAVNHAVGGAAKSQHQSAEAADIRVPGMTPRQLAIFIRDHIPNYDQVILEFDSWVHVSFVKDHTPRGSQLTAVKHGGKTVYIQGISSKESK